MQPFIRPLTRQGFRKDPKPAESGFCDRRSFEVGSKYTKNSVQFLTRTPEFQLLDKVKLQGESIQLAWLWGFMALVVILYADFMTNVTTDNSKTPLWKRAINGSFLNYCNRPIVYVLGFLFSTLYAGPWIVMAVWQQVYDDPSRVFRVALQYALAVAFLTFFPFSGARTPYFVDFDLYKPHTIAVPFLASFLPGFLFFFPRFAPRWKSKPLYTVPCIYLPPMFGVFSIVAWYSASVASVAFFEDRPILPEFLDLADTIRYGALDIVGRVLAQQNLRSSTGEDYNALIGLIQDATANTVVFAWTLGASCIFGTSIFHIVAFLYPSSPRLWAMTICAIAAAASYLFAYQMMTVPYGVALGAVMLVLLVKGTKTDAD